jgi:photosystem II stability/assembly factor-like uncharacterized protein
MRRFARPFLLVPMLALLVVLPALLISFATGASQAEGSTIPTRTTPYRTRTPVRTPAPAPSATPSSTATRTPTQTPTPTRVATATRVPDPRAAANGYPLAKVFVNRLSPVLYGLTVNGRLYRSPNDGGTWRLVASQPQVLDFVYGPEDPGILYAGALDCAQPADAGQLLRSTDGGSGWSMIETEIDLAPLLVEPDDSLSLLAAGCDGLYASNDGGLTWEPRSMTGEGGIQEGYLLQTLVPAWYVLTAENMEQSTQSLYGLAANEDGGSIVLVSEDSGATWSVITPYLEGVELRISSLTADIFERGRVWFSDETGVWETLDDGQFWAFSNQGIDKEATPQTVVLHPGERLYLGATQGLYSRPAEGTRWSLVGDRGLPSQSVEEVLFTDSRPDVLWLNTVNGVFTYSVP